MKTKKLKKKFPIFFIAFFIFLCYVACDSNVEEERKSRIMFFIEDNKMEFSIKTGSKLMGEQLKQLNETLEIFKEGYNFSGWYPNKDFSGSKIAIDNFIPEEREYFFYGNWTAKQYSVKFDVNGGTPINSKNIIYPNKLTKPDPNPTRSGATFYGWYKENNFRSSFNFSDEVIKADTTLYAKWESKLLASDKKNKAEFGRSIAVDGNTMVVGASGFGGNVAYVFTKNGNTWVQSQKLSRISVNNYDHESFGFSVAIEGDTIVVGAPRESIEEGKIGTGTAYIFTRNGDTWSQTQKLLASDKWIGDNFGENVAIHGNTIIVGAPFVDSNLDSNGEIIEHGAAYVFTKNNNIWSQTQKLLVTDKKTDAYLGVSIALNDNILVVGATYDTSEGVQSGSAYIFTKNGNSWIQSQKIVANDKSVSDHFGVSVAIDNEDSILVGAHREDSDGKDNNGAVYVFTKNGDIWEQSQKILADDRESDDLFGISVAVEGNTMIVGAYREDSGTKTENGKVYVFTKNNNKWNQQGKILATDKDTLDLFGYAVTIKNNTIFVGAYLDDNNGKSNNGAVYVYE